MSFYLIDKPTINGAQTALVVGSEGEEIETDDYGRVKVQFHWDRKGQKNEHSSCWIRVAQLWAGKNWGAVFMPRIGQEVLVHFLEGDPDRPLIMGTVYNGDHATPYDMINERSKSGIRTASTKNASPDEYHELRFDDTKGSEELFIQAQKDFNQLIKHNLSTTVQNDHSHSTSHNSTVNVGNDYSHSTTNNSTVSVGNDYRHSTTHDATLTVGNNLSHTISKDVVINVGNNLNESVQNNLNHNIGNTGLVEANQSLTLRVGGNSILINAQGIYINGVQVKINQSG